MSTRSKRLMFKIKNRVPHVNTLGYHYSPQKRLVARLARQLGMTEIAVREQIFKERKYLLEQTYQRPFQDFEI